jgi:hypothetical protein
MYSYSEYLTVSFTSLSVYYQYHARLIKEVGFIRGIMEEKYFDLVFDHYFTNSFSELET